MIFASVVIFAACSGENENGTSPSPSPEVLPMETAQPSVDALPTETTQSTGQIFLYGERHGEEVMMQVQLERWYEYYHHMGMRHLFVELGFFAAEFLNMWMQSDTDEILYQLFDDWEGTAKHVPYTLDFYKAIKRDFPETIFHGTDIGHQYDITGTRFLRYLEETNQQGTERYLLTQEAIEQGRHYYSTNPRDEAFRVNSKADNFIRAFDRLIDQSIMGIYGGTHAYFGDYGSMGLPEIPTLAERLRERYGDAVFSRPLWREIPTPPIKTGTIIINGVEYEASFFGEQDISAWTEDFQSRAFWRVENAYDDFKDKPFAYNLLPFNNYPMTVEVGQVFVIYYTRIDGTVNREYHRASGDYWNDMPITIEFIP